MPAKKNKFQIDSEKKFKLYADSIKAMPHQLKQAWEQIQALYTPKDYQEVENIVFCGMGGSALGARVVNSFAFDRLRVPFEIYNGYSLPHFVNTKSLVIVSSYSGNTEETIASTYEAIKRKAKIFAITTGGELSKIIKKEKLPSFIFDPIHNPSGQPRMAIGYATGGVLAILKRLGIISLEDEQVEKAINLMHELATEYNENAPAEKNLAKIFADKIWGKVPVLVASEHLVGCLHAVKNQFNESAKTFCFLFDIPELNHHLMEGLQNPAKIRELFSFLFVNSNLYSQEVKKRYPITWDVVEKNAIPTLVYTPRSEEKLLQVFETLIFGSYVVFFLAKRLKVDPLKIQWVNYFKRMLAKR